MEDQRRLTIGIPRALLYYRYAPLWQGFFDRLGVQVIYSDSTSRLHAEKGAEYAVDETCYSEKLWFGHVSQLIGKCDAILVPRISNFGRRRFMCTRFEALPDLTRTVFYHTGQKFLDYSIDVLQKADEEKAFISLGTQLGFSPKAAKKAWREAGKACQRRWKLRVKEEEQRLREPGMKILLCAHSYVIEDAYIGQPILQFLKNNGITVIRADLCDREAALKKSAELSPTCRWEVNREIMGSAALRAEHVNGMILVSAFPCGPDSMTNDMIARKLKGIPTLQLVIDGQSGTAGLETRLESFVDILRFKEGTL